MSNKNGILEDENGNSLFPKTFDFNVFNSNNQSLDNIIQGINSFLTYLENFKGNKDLSNIDYQDIYDAVKAILGSNLAGCSGDSIGTLTTSNTSSITPSGVKIHIKGSNYAFLLCWGSYTASSDSWFYPTFPWAYSSIPAVVVSKGRANSTGWAPQSWLCVANNISTTGFQMRLSDGSTNRGCWVSMGWCKNDNVYA